MNRVSIGIDNSLPSHYLNRCWVTVNWTLRNKLRWNINQNTKFSFNKMHLTISPATWRPFSSGGDELMETRPLCECFIWRYIARNKKKIGNNMIAITHTCNCFMFLRNGLRITVITFLPITTLTVISNFQGKIELLRRLVPNLSPWQGRTCNNHNIIKYSFANNSRQQHGGN